MVRARIDPLTPVAFDPPAMHPTSGSWTRAFGHLTAFVGRAFGATFVERLVGAGKSIALGSLLALGGCDQAQDSSAFMDITGIVIDDRTGQPIAGAEVSCDEATALADDLGRFSIAGLPVGDASPLRVRAAGYRDAFEIVPHDPYRIQHVVLRMRTDSVPHDAGAPSSHEDAVHGPCGTCHLDRSGALTVFDHYGAGARDDAHDHFGTGAICAACHDEDATAILSGRGARTLPTRGPGAHRFIADTCARCHLADAVGSEHTFAIGFVEASHVGDFACAPCHGDAFDGRGAGRAIPLHFDVSTRIADLQQLLGHRIAEMRIRDHCVPSTTATRVSMMQSSLTLRGDDRWLGDCDGDGVFGAEERAYPLDEHAPSLSDAAHDLAWIERDGSQGIHNPAYVLEVLDAIALRLGR